MSLFDVTPPIEPGEEQLTRNVSRGELVSEFAILSGKISIAEPGALREDLERHPNCGVLDIPAQTGRWAAKAECAYLSHELPHGTLRFSAEYVPIGPPTAAPVSFEDTVVSVEGGLMAVFDAECMNQTDPEELRDIAIKALEPSAEEVERELELLDEQASSDRTTSSADELFEHLDKLEAPEMPDGDNELFKNLRKSAEARLRSQARIHELKKVILPSGMRKGLEGFSAGSVKAGSADPTEFTIGGVVFDNHIGDGFFKTRVFKNSEGLAIRIEIDFEFIPGEKW